MVVPCTEYHGVPTGSGTLMWRTSWALEIKGRLLWFVIAGELRGRVGGRFVSVTVSVDCFDPMVHEVWLEVRPGAGCGCLKVWPACEDV